MERRNISKVSKTKEPFDTFCEKWKTQLDTRIIKLPYHYNLAPTSITTVFVSSEGLCELLQKSTWAHPHIHQIMLISFFLTPFDHFHPSGGLMMILALTVSYVNYFRNLPELIQKISVQLCFTIPPEKRFYIIGKKK